MSYSNARSYWEHYGPRILLSHPDAKYIAIYDEHGMNDRFSIFVDDQAVKRVFRDFVSIETWRGPPIIIDMERAREKTRVGKFGKLETDGFIEGK